MLNARILQIRNIQDQMKMLGDRDQEILVGAVNKHLVRTQGVRKCWSSWPNKIVLKPEGLICSSQRVPDHI